jgi:hypothetical protein
MSEEVPTADLVDASSIWHIMSNYTLQSRMQQCSITGTAKRPDDIGVFRPSTELSYVDQEGSYDISQLAIEEAARLLGWAPRAEIDQEIADLQQRVNDKTARTARDGAKIKRLEARIAELETDKAQGWT